MCVSVCGARSAAGTYGPGVPQLRDEMNALGCPTSYCCAKPKSIKIGLSSLLRRMLEGLMSLCEIPCLWRWATAERSWTKYGRA